jgi:hypothetical protein
MSILSPSPARKGRAFAVAALLAGTAFAATALAPSPARAWWRGGFFIGLPPVVVAPGPVAYPPYYYPPAYYPPYYPGPYYPPAAYYSPAPPAAQASAPAQGQGQGTGKIAYGATCYAGVYQCAAPAYTPIGQGCSCPGLGAPSYGTVQ